MGPISKQIAAKAKLRPGILILNIRIHSCVHLRIRSFLLNRCLQISRIFFFREIDLNFFFLEYNPLTGDTGSTTSSSGIANRYKGRGGGG